jgi:hypothetical protein
MSRKNSSGLNLTINGLGVLASVAEAVPALGAPAKGLVEALKLILQYAQVSILQQHIFISYNGLVLTNSKSRTTRKTCSHWLRTMAAKETVRFLADG